MIPMISNEDMVKCIWNLPDTEVIDLEVKIPEIVKSTGQNLEFQIAREDLLSVKRGLQDRISEEIRCDKIPKFTFSESSRYRLVGSIHRKYSEIFEEMSSELSSLISECNEISESKGRGVVFKITSTTLVSFSHIRRPVKNKDNLKIFIGAMYKIFYEAAGERHLRIPEKFFKISENGQLKSIDDFIIFHIKHLRTSFEHDTSLVDDPEKTKALIAQTCLKYTGKTTIIGLSPKEFLELQEKLLNDAKSFLESLKRELCM